MSSCRTLLARARTDTFLSASQPRIITADTQIGGRQVPAALNLPFGNLFFGFDNLRPPPGSAAEAAETATASAPTVPFAGVGNGNTLSGRTRTGPPTVPAGTPAVGTPAARPPPSSVTPAGVKPFAGQGQSLSGRKPIEVIEID